MKWRQIGPFRGGRVLAVTGVPGDPTTWYFGGVAGGVWKSTDAAATWQPVFDDQKIASIGAIAVADVGPQRPVRRQRRSLPARQHHLRRRRLQVARRRPDLEERRSARYAPHRRRGGRTRRTPTSCWSPRSATPTAPTRSAACSAPPTAARPGRRSCTATPRPGAIDVVFDPDNANVVYASLWQVQRTPWSLASGGPGSGLYKSSDGGVTWKHLEGHGLPDGILGRIGVSVAGGGGGRVYALIEANEGGLYRSDDGGGSWTRVNADHRFRQRAWYYSHVYADPVSPDVVYISNTGAVPLRRRRQVLRPRAGAARRPPWPVDRPARPAPPDRGQRRRRQRLGRRRQDLDPALQPADGAVLPRGGRQPLAVPRVRRAAGQLDDRHRQPRRRRRHRPPGLVSGRRRRERLHRAGPATIRRSSTPAPTAASSPATTTAPTTCATPRSIRSTCPATAPRA